VSVSVSVPVSVPVYLPDSCVRVLVSVPLV